VAINSPEILELATHDDALRVRARVPADLVYLDGHFPGQPLVAGFVQVHWARALASEHLGAHAPVSALELLKFRSPLLPLQEFELAIRASPQRIVFETTTSAGEAVSSGRFQLDAALAQHEPEPFPEPPAPESALPLLLPQAGQMRVLERVVHYELTSSCCEARIGAQTPLCDGAGAPSELAIELLAQCMAAHGGLSVRGAAASRVARGEAPAQADQTRLGFLVGARRIELRTRGFRVGERLWVRAEHQRGEVGMVAFRCALGSGALPGSHAEAEARALAHGTLHAYVEAGA
jgi:predicted hotdog family 3-hydroxylacyl-ACP dehydratase/3-hydroxymyristoyl/3-hydroxydecanoyl-(acyl carrier protein) dehydratase